VAILFIPHEYIGKCQIVFEYLKKKKQKNDTSQK
jgi:hypothetical protein